MKTVFSTGRKPLIALAAALVLSLAGSWAQAQTVTGQVLDNQREPIIGAGVVIPGRTGGAITDVDGHYSIAAKAGDVLEFSAIGYKTTQVTVGASAIVDVILPDDVDLLNEAIVTGYGAVSKKNLTTAIAKVNVDEVQKTGTTNMSQMLMGRAAGLQATLSSTQPGGGVNVTIRGGGTPLYVVDGMVMPAGSLEGADGGTVSVLPSSINRSGLAGLNPDDIESIEVLKDASASIYGIAAANGVVLITTKKGKQGRVRVSYDGSYTWVVNYPYLTPLTGKEYMQQVNAWSKELYLVNNKMGVYGPNAYDGGWVQRFSDAEIASATNYDWVGQVLRNGHINAHNIRIQGGTENVQYYLSGNFHDQLGNVANSDYQRFTLRANITANLTKWLRLGTTVNFNKNKINNGMVGGASHGRGTQADGMLSAAMHYPTNHGPYNEDGSFFTYSNIPNAVSMLKMTDLSTNEAVSTNFVADADIVKGWLSAKAQFGYNSEYANRSSYIPSDVYFDQVFQSRGNLQDNKQAYSTLEGMLIFNHQFGPAQVDAVVGMGRYLSWGDAMGIAYYDTNDIIQNYNVAAATGSKSLSSSKWENEKRSQFARASVDLWDRYVIAGTLRRDGTDKFFPTKKYSWFPSVSLAWKIFNEPFMQDVKWINLLKLRASYGVTGNDNLGTSLYGAYSPYNYPVEFSSGAVSYTPYKQTSADYPDVSWEKTIMKNVGLDFSVLGDRISGSFDYFVNDVTDRLGSANTAALSYLGTRPINGSHIQRYGWDATINTVNIQKPNLRWTSILTLSRYKSIWKERMPGFDFNNYQIRENEPTSISYFYRTTGELIKSDLSNCPSWQPESHRVPGTAILVDLNGDGQITKEDIAHRAGFPTLYWGFGNTLTWKNWDLDIFMYSQLGVFKSNYAWGWASGRDLAAQTTNASTMIYHIYNSETNPNGSHQGIGTTLITASLPEGVNTDYGMENASFVRVRNITLGYNFSSKVLQRMGNVFTGLKIYFDAQNPLTFSKYGPLDPEVNNSSGGKGTSGANYPMTRSFSLGVKASF